MELLWSAFSLPKVKGHCAGSTEQAASGFICVDLWAAPCYVTVVLFWASCDRNSGSGLIWFPSGAALSSLMVQVLSAPNQVLTWGQEVVEFPDPLKVSSRVTCMCPRCVAVWLCTTDRKRF